jgi:cystathionine beta-lyase/cystathionine gamma-synthase
MSRLDTLAVHAGELEEPVLGAATLPIFQSTVFESSGPSAAVRYPRLSNLPNHDVLGRKLAILEGGEAGLVAASGMAAITTTLLSVVGAGDHLLLQDCLYGGTFTFARDELPRLGIACDFVDLDRPEGWKAKLRPNTRAIYVESLSNPLFRVGDLEAVVAFAREYGLVSLTDSTLASPVNFRPLELGFDLVLHSATKYLNGHSDLVAGAVVGSEQRVARVRHRMRHWGGSLDPHACFLLHRGLRTLGLRVRHQNASALEIARALAGHPCVERVYYPGLPDDPHHARARRLFAGFGGALSFEVRGGDDAAQACVDRLELPAKGPSLGGVETLVTRPAVTSHAALTPAERARVGISDRLVRLSVGIEDPGDLILDLDRALRAEG